MTRRRETRSKDVSNKTKVNSGKNFSVVFCHGAPIGLDRGRQQPLKCVCCLVCKRVKVPASIWVRNPVAGTEKATVHFLPISAQSTCARLHCPRTTGRAIVF